MIKITFETFVLLNNFLIFFSFKCTSNCILASLEGLMGKNLLYFYLFLNIGVHMICFLHSSY